MILEATRGSFRAGKFQIFAGGDTFIMAKSNTKSGRLATHTCNNIIIYNNIIYYNTDKDLGYRTWRALPSQNS